MNPLLRKYLESIGLNPAASEADAQRFMDSLTGSRAEMAKTLAEQGQAESKGEEDEEEASGEEQTDDDEESSGEDEEEDEASGEDEEEDEEEGKKSNARRPSRKSNRELAIIRLASASGLSSAWAQRQIERGVSVAKAMRNALEEQAKDMKPLRVSVGEDLNRGTIGQACADAMLMKFLPRYGMTLAREGPRGKMVERDAHPRADQFYGRRSVDICAEFLRAHGVVTAGVHPNKLAQMVFDRGVMGAHSTSDFPMLLADTLNKSLTRQYQEVTPDWPKFCVKGTAPDFKQITRVSFGEVPNLAEVKEADEYTEFTIGERQEVYSLKKFGKKFVLTWEAMVNDDLGGFLRIPSQMIQAARRKEDELAFGVVTGNPKMGDNVDLFHSTHANLATATAAKGAPTTITLNAARKAMATQTGISSDVKLNLVPRYILAPWALSGTIDELLNSVANPSGTHSGVANIWKGKLEPIYNALLDAKSSVEWYLACDPGMIDTIEVSFLSGYESPTMETVDSLSPDKRVYFIRHIVAAKALDWRGLYKNPGS